MTTQDVEAKLDQDLDVVSTWLLGACLIGWASILARYLILLVFGRLHLGGWQASGLAFVSLLWSLAWLSGGFLFGFLFGIPKVLQKDPAGPGAPALKVNTNLEDISDWLTKILVGATLTQIVKIPGAAVAAATFMAKGDQNGSAVSCNAAILFYFLMLGILAGYLLTRMFFAVAFARADSAPDHWAQILGPLGGAAVTIGAGIAPSNPATQTAAVASQSIPLTQSLSVSQAVALAVGASLAGNPDRALKASTLAIQQSPNDPSAQYAYALALHSMGVDTDRTIASLQTAISKTTAATDPSLMESIYTSFMYLSLYQPPPEGYERALQAVAAYDEKKGPPSAAIEINRACAYGQRARDLRTSEAMSNQYKAARDSALAAVKKAIQIDPSSSRSLKQLLWVTGAPDDDDLAVFQNDPDFEALLPRG